MVVEVGGGYKGVQYTIFATSVCFKIYHNKELTNKIKRGEVQLVHVS